MGAIEPLELVLRLVAATLCGGLIGLERELHGKPVQISLHEDGLRIDALE